MHKIVFTSIFFLILPLYLQAQELNVKTIERKPFVFIQGENLSGFSIDLWEEIAWDNKWDFTYHEATSFVELLRSTRDQTSDLAIANISATKDRAELMDFSDPIFDSGLQIMTQKKKPFEYFYQSFSTAQSILLLITISVYSWLTIYLMAIVESRSKRNKPKKSMLRAMRTLFTLGSFGKSLPHTSVGKSLLIVWIIVIASCVSLYIMSLSNSASVLSAANEINSYEDLRGKKVGTTRGSTSQAFLRKHKIPAAVYASPDSLFTATALGEIDAAVHDVALMSYFASTQGKGLVTILPQVYEQEYYAIALPLGSELREPINNSLDKIRQNGTYDTLYKKWFTQN